MTRRWLALGVLTLAVLLIGVDGTVLALATPFIQQDLGASFLQILWIGDIYSFVLAALLISMGSSATVSATRSSCSVVQRLSPSSRCSPHTRRAPRC